MLPEMQNAMLLRGRKFAALLLRHLQARLNILQRYVANCQLSPPRPWMRPPPPLNTPHPPAGRLARMRSHQVTPCQASFCNAFFASVPAFVDGRLELLVLVVAAVRVLWCVCRAVCSWSVSFYPQVLLNFRRKTSVGLSFDFLMYNVLAFSCYAAFTGEPSFGKHPVSR